MDYSIDACPLFAIEFLLLYFVYFYSKLLLITRNRIIDNYIFILPWSISLQIKKRKAIRSLKTKSFDINRITKLAASTSLTSSLSTCWHFFIGRIREGNPSPTRNLVAVADAASFPSSSERPSADFSLWGVVERGEGSFGSGGTVVVSVSSSWRGLVRARTSTRHVRGWTRKR